MIISIIYDELYSLEKSLATIQFLEDTVVLLFENHYENDEHEEPTFDTSLYI